MKSIASRLIGYLLAALGFAAILYFMAWLVKSDTSASAPAQYTREEVAAAVEDRDISFDPDNLPRLQVDVDYSEGSEAAWYPKGESPVLAELVAEGKLPPVAERVGPEPVVVEGVEGNGTHGGTWFLVGGSDGDVFNVMGSRLYYPGLVRWSPGGYPVVPHIAKSWEVSEDYTEFVFHLRRGMHWSDGQPFTADDIMYWWENECNYKLLYGQPPPIVQINGKLGNIERIDRYTIKFTFPEPNGLFIEQLACAVGFANALATSPAHYLRQYHPILGDRDKIDAYKEARKLASDIAVYRDVKAGNRANPELPTLGPWICQTYRANGPYTFVRNPYYYMVDTQGNQLPYVDQIHYSPVTPDMMPVIAAGGQVSWMTRGLGLKYFTYLMGERESSGYDVFHWSHGSGSPITISPNLNLKVDPDKPETKWKHELLNDKRFRQALSLAINRQAIIDAEYDGRCVPCQTAPNPDSYFYHDKLFHSFTAYDPAAADALLDEIGLTQRDWEGFRTFPDGSRMLFYLNFSDNTPEGAVPFILDDWAAVGVRTIQRNRNRQLFDTEREALMHDFTIWGSGGVLTPALSAGSWVPHQDVSNYALAYGRWFSRGGMNGDPRAGGPGCWEPPKDHPLRKSMELFSQVVSTGDRARQRELLHQIFDIAAENVWTISIGSAPPAIGVVKDGFRNTCPNAVDSWTTLSPGNGGVETWYFEEPLELSAAAWAELKSEIVTVTPPPDAPDLIAGASSEFPLKGVIKYLLWGIFLIGTLLVAVKHPYVGRRLLIMVPTLAVISVIVFTIIQLPPGDFINSRIMRLKERGDEADLQEMLDLRKQFHLDESVVSRYVRWMGLRWFIPSKIQVEANEASGGEAALSESAEKQHEWKWTCFRAEDEGLLQGNLGRSMENSKEVNQIVGNRILLTVLISLGTIVFTWTVAVPTGIYSAVRQYSPGDYVLTLIGFVGMCIPSFLLALLIMFASKKWLGIQVSGLFSAEYGAQPEWDWPKILDLLKHIWVPVVVLGVGGTAGMIRVMRGNLLDELKKPYVTTARAKGVRPAKLIMKYPVRLALNPFISGIGGIFPMLISGGAIVAVVLSLQTVGPALLNGLLNEDFYLAGSMLMVLSLLGIFGTLVSDLLLLWLDPRIRFQGGQR